MGAAVHVRAPVEVSRCGHRAAPGRAVGAGGGPVPGCRADRAGRRLFAPPQLPAGVLTAAIGGPYLIFLLLRGRRRSS
ncbi:iron chelate uptake ABC transporter family permease subunit [Micromonospora arida]|uniref:iron chelate uptake ABC transporter family permease subunit n=1 Tax=Micromonospora arida TaxID=2203715 RepID=UPI0024477BF9|nr:iron chelate uptake ABC transporter family permease subunit [Micromonospora arida]